MADCRDGKTGSLIVELDADTPKKYQDQKDESYAREQCSKN